MSTINNAANVPLNERAGSVPQMGGALRNWFQPMLFKRVTKEVLGGQAYETSEAINFRGVIQPLSGARLMLKPEGQRAWNWQLLHADPSLSLEPDEVVTYLGVQTRIMARKNYQLYQYVEYEIVQDWTGAGPVPVPIIDGGDTPEPSFEASVDGGDTPSPDYFEFIDGGQGA